MLSLVFPSGAGATFQSQHTSITYSTLADSLVFLSASAMARLLVGAVGARNHLDASLAARAVRELRRELVAPACARLARLVVHARDAALARVEGARVDVAPRCAAMGDEARVVEGVAADVREADVHRLARRLRRRGGEGRRPKVVLWAAPM